MRLTPSCGLRCLLADQFLAIKDLSGCVSTMDGGRGLDGPVESPPKKPSGVSAHVRAPPTCSSSSSAYFWRLSSFSVPSRSSLSRWASCLAVLISSLSFCSRFTFSTSTVRCSSWAICSLTAEAAREQVVLSTDLVEQNTVLTESVTLLNIAMNLELHGFKCVILQSKRENTGNVQHSCRGNLSKKAGKIGVQCKLSRCSPTIERYCVKIFFFCQTPDDALRCEGHVCAERGTCVDHAWPETMADAQWEEAASHGPLGPQ